MQTTEVRQGDFETIAIQTVERTLLSYPALKDCAIFIRLNERSKPEWIAYVVCGGQFSAERLRSHLQAALPEVVLPHIIFVPISNLPLTTAGTVDRDLLEKIPVVDADTRLHYEAQVQAIPGIDQAAVVLQEQTAWIPPLHLSDLLPDWQKASQTAIAPSVVTTTESASEPLTETETKPPAISIGTPLPIAPTAPANLPQVLQQAASQPTDPGVIYLQADGSAATQSYATLLGEAEQILAGLRKLGLQPQAKVLFQVEGNHNFIPAFWSCFLGGFVPVPISPAPVYEVSNSIVKKLLNAWERLDQPLILTTREQLPKLLALASQLQLENFRAAAIEDLRQNERDSNYYPSQPADLALLLLTSGSTGTPKGVMLTHQNLLSSVAGTAWQSDFTSEDIFLNWLPLDHPGPIIRCVIRPVFLGAQQIHAPTSAILANPLKWFDWIEQYQVTSAWAPNFAYALVCDRADAIKQGQWDLSCVRSFLSAAELIAPQTSRRFLDLLAPHGLQPTAMHSSWGMAETSSGVTSCETYLLDNDSPSGTSFADVGAPIPGISLRIVNAQNQVLPEETIGCLQVKGATVTPGYYQNPDLNQEVFDPEGWFSTGDLGFLRQGRLTITGRTKDIIIINGANYYTHEIEAVVEEIDGVEASFTAACATRQPSSNTDQLVLFFHITIADDKGLIELLKEI